MSTEEIVVSIKSFISGQEVTLVGILSDVQDSWSSNWKKEQVYGRTDPIATFVGNERTISFQLIHMRNQQKETDVNRAPKGDFQSMSQADKQKYAASLNNGRPAQAMKNINKFARMIYPGYEDISDSSNVAFNTSVLKSSPILGLKIANIVSGLSPGSFLPVYCTSFSKVVENKAAFDTASITSNGSLSIGFFHRIVVSFSFTVIHDFNIGHDSEGNPFTSTSQWPFVLE